MKRKNIIIIFLALFIIISASCTGLFDLGDEKIEDFTPPDDTPEASIFFNNFNYFDVDVFSNSSRTGNYYSVPAGEQFPIGTEIPWIKAEDGFVFYLTYYLPIGDNKIPYIPEDNMAAHIVKPILDIGTQIDIPDIEGIIPSDEPLFHDIFIFIKNNTQTTVELLSGNSVVPQVNGNSLVDTSGRTGLFKIDKNSLASGYSLYVNKANHVPLGIDNFQNGYIYEIELNVGNVVTIKDSELTLEYFISTLSQAKLNFINAQRSLRGNDGTRINTN